MLRFPEPEHARRCDVGCRETPARFARLRRGRHVRARRGRGPADPTVSSRRPSRASSDVHLTSTAGTRPARDRARTDVWCLEPCTPCTPTRDRRPFDTRSAPRAGPCAVEGPADPDRPGLSDIRRVDRCRTRRSGSKARSVAPSTTPSARWPPFERPPAHAPNIVMVLLDDVGYAQFGCYGSDIATPTFDQLAARGLRYSNFHTTALCSPTRGVSHDRTKPPRENGMARVVEFSSGFPGYDATIPSGNGFLSQILANNGYATFALGKWHLTPATEKHELRRSANTLAAAPRFRPFLRFPGRRNRSIPSRSRPRQPSGSPAVNARRRIPPDRRSRRPCDRLPEGPARLRSEPAVLRVSRSRRLPRTPPGSRRTSSQTVDGSIRLGCVARTRLFGRQVESGSVLPAGTELSERPSRVPPGQTPLYVDERGCSTN